MQESSLGKIQAALETVLRFSVAAMVIVRVSEEFPTDFHKYGLRRLSLVVIGRTSDDIHFG